MLSAVVVGGSLAGLLAGNVFKSQGYTVCILERSMPATLQSEAAGIRVGSEVLRFLETYVEDYARDFAKRTEEVNVVDQRGNVVTKCYPPEAMNLTTWKALYEILKNVLLHNSDNVRYETGKSVQGIEYTGDSVTVIYQDVESGIVERIDADLVVGADGLNSIVRRLVYEEHDTSKYSGYVTWRGRVPKTRLSRKTFDALHWQVPVFRTGSGYIISYHVPGDPARDAFKSQPCDDFVWVWYDAVPEASAEFASIMTDDAGVLHRSTVPRGKVDPRIWHRQLTEKRPNAFQNPHFIELLEKTEQPFISAIRSYAGSKAVFCDGKILLIGNALATPKPNAAMATGQAAYQALKLGRVLSGDLDLDHWEKECVEYAMRARSLTDSMEEFYVTGRVPDTLRSFVTPPRRSNI
ncbi:FAD/NAD(P)-binding domain-containing protein [Lophiostoma macrostomum CBS 122681]|uniref:FAD/NAD(P)-binding domain-containing protein n=1 Tax=Lophiostoma macrostomum CBS 122681 TaxID=1314788 RepID=A0A6A6TCN3_9PLEO|nr:FAD/NAD(P)-binding domain-containing protein [Lophiostoma macrostomum CBS 122681]